MAVCACLLQEEDMEICHRKVVVDALYQAMSVLSPGQPFLRHKQVLQLAEKRPDTPEAFMTMSLHGLSSARRSAHGPVIMETLRQVFYTVYDWLMMQLWACVFYIIRCMCE